MEFPNIKYSSAWLADKFPGFYMDECYYILSYFLRDNYKTTVVKRKAEKLEVEQEEHKVENNAEMETEIRSYKSECENGVQPEQLTTLPESEFEFEWEISRRGVFTQLQSESEYQCSFG